jgi:hypothetical protein
MPFNYSATNLVTAGTLLSVSTESTIYKKEFLYDDRPSKPFYFTAKAGQTIYVDLGAIGTPVDLIALFNHNLTLAATMQIEANDLGFPGAALWTGNFTWRQYDEYILPRVGYRYWLFTFTDAANPSLPRIGELWMGDLCAFTKAYVRPGREDGKTYHAVEQQTNYGQDWDVYLSEQKEFKIAIDHIHEDPSTVDEIEVFLSSIAGPAGRFVLIPDIARPHVFFVKVVGSPGAQRPIVGEHELREWSLAIRELTRGITVL